MKLKTGVTLQGIRPELIIALMVAESIYSAYNRDMVITSVCDGKHSATSLHYSGCAVDLRTRGFSKASDAAKQIKEALGVDYDVILEQTHLHIEYQPRYA